MADRRKGESPGRNQDSGSGLVGERRCAGGRGGGGGICASPLSRLDLPRAIFFSWFFFGFFLFTSFICLCAVIVTVW
jgi:hypothetical protein